MESKPAGDFRSPLDPIYTNTMAKTIDSKIFERTSKRHQRGCSANIARIEKLKDTNRMMSLKFEGTDYPIWIEDLYLTLQIYVQENERVTGLLEYAT